MALDNPAGRLHDLFLSTCSAGGDTNVLAYWVGFFGMQEVDTFAERIRIYNHVVETVAECKELINKVSNSSVLFIKPLEDIEIALMEFGTRASCVQLCSKISDVTLSGLQYCDYLLRKEGKVEDVEADSDLLLDLAADVETLIETVVNTAAFPDDIKAALLKGLEEIRTAIMLYRLRGAAGLRDALGKNVMMCSEIYDYFQTDEGNQNQDVAISYGNILVGVNSIISVALKAKQLAEPLLPFLKRLGSGEDGS